MPRNAQSQVPATMQVASLFCGAGGLDLGFDKARFETCFACDFNEAAVESYNFNRERDVAECIDLSKISPCDLVDRIKKSKKVPNGIIGGPPCQGFSRGNQCSDPSDPRNLLPYRYVQALEALDSAFGIDFFVFENVPGLKSIKHIDRFNRIKRRFEKLGYVLHEKQIDASEYGVPQRRQRLFLVGFSKRVTGADAFSFPEGRMKKRVVRDAIGSLPNPIYFGEQSEFDEIPFHPNHWTMRPRSDKFSLQSFNRGRSFRQLKWSEPSYTVAYGNREIHVHPDGTRRLSILEAMLLQGFPQTYILRGNFSQQVEQVSNAVPPPLAFAIATAVKKKLQESRIQRV